MFKSNVVLITLTAVVLLPAGAGAQFQNPNAPATDQYTTTGTAGTTGTVGTTGTAGTTATSGTAGTSVTGTTSGGGGIGPDEGSNNPPTGTTGTTTGGGGQGPDTGAGDVNPNTTVSSGTGRNLPFTGVDLLLVVLLGLLLVAAGTMIRAVLRVRRGEALARLPR